MRHEANPLVLSARAHAPRHPIGLEKPVSQHCVVDARVWRTRATLAGFIISASFLSSVPASGQSMSHDMPGMEHEHGAAARRHESSHRRPRQVLNSPRRPCRQ